MIYSPTKPGISAKIDWSDPLSQGLVGCWLFNEGGGSKAYNLVTGIPATIGGTGGIWVPEGFKTTTATSIRSTADTLLNNTSWAKGLTVVFVGTQLDGGMSYPMFVTQDDTGTGAGGFNLRGNTDTEQLTLTCGASNLATYSSLSAYQLNKRQFLAGTYSNPIGTNYVNGKATNSSSGSVTVPTGQEINIGCRKLGTTYNTALICNCVFLYNRALSANEIQQLHEMTKGW